MPPQPPPARDAPVRFVQVNPRRRGSKAHARYERYKHGASIAEALRLGALPGDIAWDLQRGFVRAAAGGGATVFGGPGPSRVALARGGERWFQVLAHPNLGLHLRVMAQYPESELLRRCSGPAELHALQRCLRDPGIFRQVARPRFDSVAGFSVEPRSRTSRPRPSLPPKGFARRSAATLARCILEHTVVQQA